MGTQNNKPNACWTCQEEGTDLSLPPIDWVSSNRTLCVNENKNVHCTNLFPFIYSKCQRCNPIISLDVGSKS